MRKLFIIAILLVAFGTVKSQNVKRKIGVGLQSSFPIFGLSFKYAISKQSVFQATIAPFGVSSGETSVNMNFYGARYIYRFSSIDDGVNTVIDPYAFVGGGLCNYTTTSPAYVNGSISNIKKSDSFFGYSAGVGIEVILASKFGISGELGYGKLRISSGVAASTILSGLGVHFYIK